MDDVKGPDTPECFEQIVSDYQTQLECPTGVKGINYDRLTNEGKGAWFADDAEYYFGVDMAAEMMYVDMQNSTENCLRIYYYCVFFEKLADGESPVLTAATVSAGAGPEEKVFEPQEIVIPASKAVSTVRFTAEDGSRMQLRLRIGQDLAQIGVAVAQSQPLFHVIAVGGQIEGQKGGVLALGEHGLGKAFGGVVVLVPAEAVAVYHEIPNRTRIVRAELALDAAAGGVQIEVFRHAMLPADSGRRRTGSR